MLTHLAIKDLAIIEATELSLADGLNVLTGETGAGKSIVIGALNLVLGGRASTGTIRRGCDRAEAHALFRVPAEGEVADRLRELDLVDTGEEPSESGEIDLVVRRIVRRNGRGRAYVNGALVNVRTLAGITEGLVDISSQHEHTRLLEAARHLDLLDRFGDLAGERETFNAAWTALVGARASRDALTEREQTRLQREDWVRFQLDEIEDVADDLGEEETLRQERERLAHAGELVEGSRGVERGLTGGKSGAVDAVITAQRALERVASIDEELAPTLERLEGARIELEDIAYEMRRYSDSVSVDPRRLEEIESRISTLKRLGRKHGLDPAGLRELADQLRAELAGFDSLEDEIARAEAEVEVCDEAAMAAAQALSAARHAAANDLEGRVGSELADLAMGGATIRFDLQPTESLGPRGIDSGQILIETNTGEGYKPLKRVASGGELSRLLLAFKSVLNVLDDVATGVFDEVDAGVGGAIAEVIGLKLAQLARNRQVIAITHLAQIASHASHHLKVAKESTDGRTATSVAQLDMAARVEEVARMLGGVDITDATRNHAAELLTRQLQAPVAS